MTGGFEAFIPNGRDARQPKPIGVGSTCPRVIIVFTNRY